MYKKIFCILTIIMTQLVFAQGAVPSSPEVGARTYAQNYKDMVLAECLATAYKSDPTAAKDIGSSVSALRDWGYYDMEQSPDAVKDLIARYLKRDYHNLLVESEIKDVRFDFLKCMDLYHSQELVDLSKKFVINPDRTYRQDNPPTTK
jgi:hypothetical protein